MSVLEELRRADNPAQRDRILEDLWSEFADVPLAYTGEHPDGALESDWLDFPAGTDKLDIWHWFDELHSQGVHSLMFPKEPTLSFEDRFGDEQKVTLSIHAYTNGNLAILMESEDGEFGFKEPYADLTRNILPLPPYIAAVDANNLPASALQAVLNAGLAQDTGHGVASGFCMYPLFRFSPEKLCEFDPQGAKEYNSRIVHSTYETDAADLDDLKQMEESSRSFSQDRNREIDHEIEGR